MKNQFPQFSVLKSHQRGFANHGWLKSFHTFSFAGYHNENYMGFGNLRVINQDTVQGGSGFSTHPHKNMEIISYVVKGGLEHADSMGNKTIIVPGEVQRMSAGTGVTHSEYNHEKNTETEFFQIWVLPKELNTQPSYDQKIFSNLFNSEKPIHVLGEKNIKNSDSIVTCNQDIEMWIAKPRAKNNINFISSYPNIWVQIISGKAKFENYFLEAGDAIYGKTSKIQSLEILEDSHLFYFLQF
jgi:quercetin 2,3-dioxygenase